MTLPAIENTGYADEETLFVTLVKEVLPGFRATISPEPSDHDKNVVVVRPIPAADSDLRAAQRWNINFNVSSHDRETAKDAAVRLHKLMLSLSEAGYGEPDLGYVGYVRCLMKPYKAATGSAKHQYSSSYGVTLQARPNP